MTLATSGDYKFSREMLLDFVNERVNDIDEVAPYTFRIKETLIKDTLYS